MHLVIIFKIFELNLFNFYHKYLYVFFFKGKIKKLSALYVELLKLKSLKL